MRRWTEGDQPAAFRRPKSNTHVHEKQHMFTHLFTYPCYLMLSFFASLLRFVVLLCLPVRGPLSVLAFPLCFPSPPVFWRCCVVLAGVACRGLLGFGWWLLVVVGVGVFSLLRVSFPRFAFACCWVCCGWCLLAYRTILHIWSSHNSI